MFIDTNVFVYARFDGTPQTELARKTLYDLLNDPTSPTISRQVIREYLATTTRQQTWAAPLSMREALKDVVWLTSLFTILEDGPATMNELEHLCRDVKLSGRQVHDANIVATMMAHGERQLLTFNSKDFRRYGDRLELLEFS